MNHSIHIALSPKKTILLLCVKLPPMCPLWCVLCIITIVLVINLYSDPLLPWVWSGMKNLFIASSNNSHAFITLLLLGNLSYVMQWLCPSTAALTINFHLNNLWLESRCQTTLELLLLCVQCLITSIETVWKFLIFFSVNHIFTCLTFIPLLRRWPTE